jgi:hypothetical protein
MHRFAKPPLSAAATAPHAAASAVAGPARRGRRLPAIVCAAALAAMVGGCANDGATSSEMEASIRSTLNSESMPVKSVNCTPRISELEWTDPPAHLSCLVHFKDGTSYRTPATVQPVVDQPDALTWDAPPNNRGVLDITKAPLPVPSSTRSASSPSSLFNARNLRPVVAALNTRFRNQSIVQLAIYPGELEAVIANNGYARFVTTKADGTLSVGPALSFEGSRNAIYPSQILPAVPGALAQAISQHSGVRLARLARFELYYQGQNAYWDIYPISGEVRFTALLQGQSLKMITKTGTRPVR